MPTQTSPSARVFSRIIVGDFTYPVGTGEAQFNDVKYTDDFEQSIIVPYFDSWKEVSTVVFFPSTMDKPSTFDDITGIYYITGRRITSITQQAIEFDLRYDSVSSLMREGKSIAGIWSRCPTLYTPWITQVPVSDALKPSRYYNLVSTEQLNTTPTRYVYWVQITATVDLSSSSSSNKLTVYGFPIVFPVNYNLMSTLRIDSVQTYYVDNESDISDTSVTLYRYPTLGEFINNPTLLGIQSSQITDISISRICPYYYNAGVGIRNLNAINYFRLCDSSGATSYAISHNDTYAYYNISNNNYVSGEDFRQLTTTVTLTDTEIQTGKVYIRDADGNYCLEIPTAWFDSSNQIKIVMQCHADYGQMYYHIGIDTDTAIGVRKTIALPCAHLPYIGTEWNEYKAFSQAFDREQMYYSVAQTAVNAGVGIASGNEFAIGNAIGTVGNIANTIYSQNLKERRLQAQPARGYALAYGISYITKTLEHPYAIVIETPANLTTEIYNRYIKDYGYAVEGYQSLTVTTGYYEGIALPMNNIGGEELEYLNDELRQGVRIV